MLGIQYECLTTQLSAAVLGNIVYQLTKYLIWSKSWKFHPKLS